MKREDFKVPVLDSIRHHGGHVTTPQVAKYIWDNFEPDIRSSGNIIYTWQYEMRWAADTLVKEGKIKKKKHGPGLWSLI